MDNKPFFSIAIPTYEMGGFGYKFLKFNFDKLKTQSFKDFEVVISDHSESDIIKDLCIEYSNILNIKYFRNTNKRGSSSANINNAIINSEGKWIKILFQDDFLYEFDSLEKINNYIKSDPESVWIASGCEHTNDGYSMYRPFYPKWSQNIELGNNTISSPSVICIKNESPIYFNEDLIWLMDVEYYRRMYNLYGEPKYLYDIIVVNRTWNNSVSNTISQEIKNKEIKIVLDLNLNKEVPIINNINKETTMEKILSEKSEHHWTYFDVLDKNVLDLGCGRHWTTDINDSSSVYFGNKGAKKVVSFDMSSSEIEYFNNNNPDKEKYLFFCDKIESSEFVKSLILKYNINAIKSDIEGSETLFYNMTKEDMSGIEEIAIEYHSPDIFNRIIEKINEWGFSIKCKAKFTYDPNFTYLGSVDVDESQMGVIFCSRNEI